MYKRYSYNNVKERNIERNRDRILSEYKQERDMFSVN